MIVIQFLCFTQMVQTLPRHLQIKPARFGLQMATPRSILNSRSLVGPPLYWTAPEITSLPRIAMIGGWMVVRIRISGRLTFGCDLMETQELRLWGWFNKF